MTLEEKEEEGDSGSTAELESRRTFVMRQRRNRRRWRFLAKKGGKGEGKGG